MKRFRSILGFCLPLAAFAGLAWLVCQHRQGLWWDVAILQAVRTTHRPWLDRLVTGFTPLGIWWGVLPAALVMVGVLAYRGKWRSVLYVEIAFMGTAVLNFVAKLFFHRVRPHLWEDVPLIREYSFPSGHAMASLALVLAIVVLTWQSRWRPLAIVGGGAFVLAIGWTRLYLGIHYPSDIIGGWLLETAWMAMSVLLVQPPPFYQGERPQLPEIPPPKSCN